MWNVNTMTMNDEDGGLGGKGRHLDKQAGKRREGKGKGD